MAERSEVEAFLQQLLQPEAFKDYGPNGLQVEGRPQVRCIASGVTASLAFIDAALAAGADTLLVHHGLFWRGQDGRLTGWLKARVARLLAHELNLFAYHLPLDAHPELGNNRRLGDHLGIDDASPVEGTNGLLWRGRLPGALPAGAWADAIGAALGRRPLHLPGGPALVRDVAWCTGAAQGQIERAADLGCDAFLSGEVSEHTTHVARERGIHYLAAGHHATERLGIQALGDELARVFGVRHSFVDIDNPA